MIVVACVLKINKTKVNAVICILAGCKMCTYLLEYRTVLRLAIWCNGRVASE